MDNYADGLASGLALGQNNNNGYGMGYGAWGEWIWIIVLFALWGNGGWGFGNGGNNGALTRGDLCQDMNFNNLDSAVRSLQSGLCDGFYAVNTSLLNGFGNTNTAIMQNGYETRSAINGVSQQLASCCCDLRAGQADIKYQMATDTCEIKQAINGSTQRILDFLCNEKISALQSENAALNAQLSQNSQTQTLLNAINRTPSPAFVVPNPYTGAYGYNNSGCGCGCGCN